jgi:hypothetical protein
VVHAERPEESPVHWKTTATGRNNFRINMEGLRHVLAGSDRCCRSSGSASKRWLHPQASGSQVRLQDVAIRPGSKHAGDCCIAASEGSRYGRSRRRTVEDVEMRTFGDLRDAG